MIKGVLLRIAPLLLGMSILLAPATAAAWDPFGGVNCSKVANSSAVCTDRNKTTNPLTGTNGLIIKIANVISIIAGIAAVIVIIVGGLKYVVANGDSSAINSAKNTILYALVGLVVIALARTIITFVVSRI